MTVNKKTEDLLSNLKNLTDKDNKEVRNFMQPVVIPISNQYGEDENGTPIYIDRMYGSLHKTHRLVQKDGTEYKGKIFKKKRLIERKSMLGEKNNFYSVCYVTDDGRWFDNSGMPIDPPSKTQPDEELTDNSTKEDNE